MTVPTKAAMKQLLDERMIGGSASNRLPQAMFFLQLNLSGVIILLSLMFYANALGESFVMGVCFFSSSCFSVVWCMCGYALWLKVSVMLHVFVRVRMGRGAELVCVWQCLCVVLFFKHSENISIPLSPACVALIISCMHQGFSLMEITRLKSHHAALKRRESVLARACLLWFAFSVEWRGWKKSLKREEEKTDIFMQLSGCK